MSRSPMDSVPEVRRLRADEWSEFRRLRLEALATDPLAFGSTSAREQAYPETQWQDWARRGSQAPTTPTFVVDAGFGNLVGMAGVFRREPDFMVWGMWVAPKFRGLGLGDRLMDAIVMWVDTAFPGERLLLEVNPVLAPAVRTYLSHGFAFTGKEEPLERDPPGILKEMIREPWGRGPVRKDHGAP